MNAYAQFMGRWFKVKGERSVIIWRRVINVRTSDKAYVVRFGAEGRTRRQSGFALLGRAQGIYETRSVQEAKRVGDQWLDEGTMPESEKNFRTPEEHFQNPFIIRE